MAEVDQAVPAAQTGKKKKGSSRLARREARWGLLFISPWIVGFLLWYLIPMIASLVFSTFNYSLADPTATKFIGATNWQRALLEDPNVIRGFSNTFKFAIITLPLGLVFALYLAVLLNSKSVMGKNVFRTLFYMPTMVPAIATVLIWRAVLNEQSGWYNVLLQKIFNLINSIFGTTFQAIGTQGIRWLADPRLIYYTYTWIGFWGVGNVMLILLAGLQNVPTELYEAAEIDGAGWWRRLLNITLPMISPVIFYNLVLGVIGILQYFLTPFVLTGGSGFPDGKTLFFMIYFYQQSFTFMNMGYGATLAWILFIIALAFTVGLFGTARYWVYYAAEEA